MCVIVFWYMDLYVGLIFYIRVIVDVLLVYVIIMSCGFVSWFLKMLIWDGC